VHEAAATNASPGPTRAERRRQGAEEEIGSTRGNQLMTQLADETVKDPLGDLINQPGSGHAPNHVRPAHSTTLDVNQSIAGLITHHRANFERNLKLELFRVA